MIPCSVGENGRIEHFAAGAALPGVEGADEIIVLLSVHSAFAFRTLHGRPPLAIWVADKWFEPWTTRYLYTRYATSGPERRRTLPIALGIANYFFLFNSLDSFGAGKKKFSPGRNPPGTDPAHPLQVVQAAKIAIFLTVFLNSASELRTDSREGFPIVEGHGVGMQRQAESHPLPRRHPEPFNYGDFRGD